MAAGTFSDPIPLKQDSPYAGFPRHTPVKMFHSEGELSHCLSSATLGIPYQWTPPSTLQPGHHIFLSPCCLSMLDSMIWISFPIQTVLRLQKHLEFPLEGCATDLCWTSLGGVSPRSPWGQPAKPCTCCEIARCGFRHGWISSSSLNKIQSLLHHPAPVTSSGTWWLSTAADRQIQAWRE